MGNMFRRNLQDIANETGFAVSTISAVLNKRPDCYASEKTRRKIEAVAQRIGYRPNYFASALRSRKSRIVGIIGAFKASELQAWQCNGIQDALTKKGYIVVLIDTRRGLAKAFNEFDTLNADGVVVFYDRDDLKVAEKLSLQLPVVAIASQPIPGMSTMVIDRKAGIEKMTRHLIALGHRRILFVAHRLSGSQWKYRGYVEAMRDAGLDSEIEFIESPEMNVGSHLVVTDHLDIFRRVTAVVTTGDRVAVEVTNGLLRSGINVPKDLSVVGFGDDTSGVSSTPHITTLHVPRGELGEMAGEMLLDLIAGKKGRNRQVVPEIVIRESDAPPREDSQVLKSSNRKAQRRADRMLGAT